MKILHRHIFFSLILTLVSTLLVFTFILLFGNIFKDLLELLSNRSVTLLNIAEFFFPHPSVCALIFDADGALSGNAAGCGQNIGGS
jgi:hypothetical protein